MFLKTEILKAISFKNPVRLPVAYWILVLIRFALTVAPQLGYIHPDEFFQNVEVIAGDIFTIDVAKTWEFNPKFPIRNIFVPKMILGPPLHFIRLFNPYTKYYLGINLRTPFYLLVIPRLFLCLLSFVNDYCIYKICVLYGQNFRHRLIIFASSYIVLVYCCRSFSNTFEMTFFSVLLLLVAECMLRSDKIIYHDEFLREKYNKASTPVEKVKLFKLKMHLPEHSLNHVFLLATIVVVGIFNRPTFVGFAFPPIFFWLHRGLGSKVVGFKDFHVRIFTFILCGVPTALLLILIDSAYYGYLTLADVESMKWSWDNWVVTPLNFLRYNLDMKNLTQHGLHPRWLHVAVNVPLLFSVLAGMAFITLSTNIYRFIRGDYRKLPRIQSITGLMLFSLTIPVALLSLFPHQEARFIIPALVPLVYLYGNRLHPNESDGTHHRKLKKTLLYIWFVLNASLTLFYGFIHQVTDRTIPQHAVYYIYDEAMLKHKNICEPGHVECPERIMRIHERHRDFGLLERVHQLNARRATDEEILTVHTAEHLNRLKELATTKLRELNSQKEQFDSVYFHPDSLESAAVATGCVLQMVDTVVSGGGSGVCVVRPPGHHADEDMPSGFCLLNNVAAAARHAVLTHALRRVLVLDWDVHHGNGTQRVTYGDNKILYMSVHRYDHGAFFPHSRDADVAAVGAGSGEGYNVNVPWNKRGMGDAEYMAAFTQVILPIAYEYNPSLVLVSAGFDACVGDPLGGCSVSPECYGRMTALLRALAGGRVLLVLEGGYNTTSVAHAMTQCTKALLGDPPAPPPDPRPPHPSAVETIADVIAIHKKYWKSLKFQLALPAEDVLGEPLPSRGLTVGEDKSETCDSIKSPGVKSLADDSIESELASLTLDPKCSDGVHCGTDDEDDKAEPKPVAGAKNEPECVAAGSCVAPKPESSSSGQAGSSQAGSSAVPKQTLVDYLAENMQALVDGAMFAVLPLPWCPHIDVLGELPADVKFEQGLKCSECDETSEVWVCLHCYIRACGRSVNGHMESHHSCSSHALVLSLSDLSVWCYACDAYVDHPRLYAAKDNAHLHKFNEHMPYCYRSDTLHME